MKLRPVGKVPVPGYPVPRLWVRGCAAARMARRAAAVACSAGLLGFGGCGAGSNDAAPTPPGGFRLADLPPGHRCAPGQTTAGATETAPEGSALVTIVHDNDLSSVFAPQRVAIALDGEPVYECREGDERLDIPEALQLFEGYLAEGEHSLETHLEYHNVPYGLGYVLHYVFRVHSSHTFEVTAGRAGRLTVTGYEQGEVTTPVEERPGVRYDWAEAEPAVVQP